MTILNSSGGAAKQAEPKKKKAITGMTKNEAVQVIKKYFHEPGFFVEAGYVEPKNYGVGIGIAAVDGLSSEKKTLVTLLDTRGPIPFGPLALREDFQVSALNITMQKVKEFLLEAV